jgi:hypothetical protein
MLAATLANLTEAQARVVLQALDQFVENTRDSVEYSGSENEQEGKDLAIAEEVLDNMNAARAALATG